MATKNINKLVRMIGTFVDKYPDLFDYAGYDDPRDVIVRLDETFGVLYRNNTSLCPDGIATIHEALMNYLEGNWNSIDDRITKAGGNSFETRNSVIAEAPEETSFEDMLWAPYHRMTDPNYRHERDTLTKNYPYLLDELSFGFCADNGKTRSIEISLVSDKLYVKAETGLNGLFIYARDEKIKRYRILDKECFSRKLNGLSIYKWPKAIPEDYVPGNHLMGCDKGSWHLSYKELGKKTFRHIHGKGAFPETPPYIVLLQILNKVDPDHDLMEWVLSCK